MFANIKFLTVCLRSVQSVCKPLKTALILYPDMETVKGGVCWETVLLMKKTLYSHENQAIVSVVSIRSSCWWVTQAHECVHDSFQAVEKISRFVIVLNIEGNSKMSMQSCWSAVWIEKTHRHSNVVFYFSSDINPIYCSVYKKYNYL